MATKKSNTAQSRQAKRPKFTTDSKHKSVTSRSSASEKIAPALKGANRPRLEGHGSMRNALGRGLASLMKTSPVHIESKQAAEPTAHANLTERMAEADSAISANGDRSWALDSTIESSATPETPAVGAPSAPVLPEGLNFISLKEIVANRTQPRKRFEQAEIDSLAASIKESGLLQPIIVRRTFGSGEHAANFEIVAGERRFRAAEKAGLETVPVLVKSLSDKEAFQLGIIENVQRADLNPIEEARAYQRLIDEFGETQADVASVIGKDRVSIANALRLLKLPESILLQIIDGRISAGHGRAILMLEDAKAQEKLAQRICAEGLSVRAAEQLASSQKGPSSKRQKGETRRATEVRSTIVEELEDRLRRGLQTKVSLHLDSEGKGEVRIHFFSKAELESLLERLNS